MEKKAVLAIDLGGTRIKIGLVREADILVADQMDSRADGGIRARLPEIESRIQALLTKASLTTADIEGIGMAIPGIVDSVNSRVLAINAKYDDVLEIDLTGWARDRFQLPFVLENDTRSALLGEWKSGNGRGYANLALMTLGTGIGTSAVIEGKLLRGKHFQAGILGGHFVTNYKGNRCNCGNIGCAEAEASTWNLHKQVVSNPAYAQSLLRTQETLDFKAIFQCAEQGDALAVTVRNDCLEVWAACALNLVQAYDPEVLILGGGVMASRDYILPKIQEKLDQNAWATWGKVTVVEASQINSAALLGISSLVYKD